MSGPSPNPSDVFDVKKIRRMVELMNEFDLSVLDLKQGDQRVRLRRGQEPVVMAGGQAYTMPAAAAPASFPSAAGGSAPAARPAEAVGNLIEIKSPMVGTFYSSASPDSPAYVKVGDRVGPDTTVCLIEAMKVFNEIPAETSGTIAEVLVQRGDPVEFGQVMFRVKP